MAAIVSALIILREGAPDAMGRGTSALESGTVLSLFSSSCGSHPHPVA